MVESEWENIKCELNEFYKTDEERLDFLGAFIEISSVCGHTGQEARNFLIKEIEKNPTNTYAMHFLFTSYIAGIEIDKAREIVWKMIAIKDCSFFRSFLDSLEDTQYIFSQVYLHGDRSKLPENLVKEHTEELINFLNEIMGD